MAEEHNPAPSEEVTTGAPLAAESPNGAITTPEEPPSSPVTEPIGGYNFKRTWLQLALGWVFAGVTFFVVLTLLGILLSYAFFGQIRSMGLAWVIAAFPTLVLFYFLDRKLWLSRYFGLQTGPNSSPLRRLFLSLSLGMIHPNLAGAAMVSGAGNEELPSTDPNAPPRPKPRPHDTAREIAETVVFVVVLVLMLKTFIAEAFVIPTGSMASTLWGYQKVVDCPQCGHRFPVNCSSESDPQSDQRPSAVVGCTCPNCRKVLEFTGVDEGPLYFGTDQRNNEEALLIISSNGQDPLLAAQFTFERNGQPVPAQSNDTKNFPVRICRLTAESKTFLDDKEVSADQMREALRAMREPPMARVRYRLSDQPAPLPVLDLDVSTTGKPALKFEAFNPPANSGDRVLVAKFLYDSGFSGPNRHDVVVFKYPKEPQKNFVALNYIKRLIGKPGETIGIHRGNLYVTNELKYPEAAGTRPVDLRQPDHMHVDDTDALKQLKADVRGGGDKKPVFTIIRKPPEAMLALSRIVYDNDHQAKDLIDNKVPPRWTAAEPWKGEDADRRYAVDGSSDVAWLHYRHLIPAEDRKSAKASLVTNFMGYNSGQSGRSGQQMQDWVGDLMLECDLTVDGSSGEVWLELSRGVDRFQARIDLSSGECKLVRFQGTLKPDPMDNRKFLLGDVKETVLDTKPTKLKAGKHHVRFANYDERLTLWIDDDLPFGPGKEYEAPPQEGPTQENDLERPAGIGVKGGKVKVEHLQVWRDTYYTTNPNGQADVDVSGDEKERASFWSDPAAWERLRNLEKFRTMYVQPGHYLCMGDNSTQSSDSRDWGLVPDRLMLGRALVVYYPFKFPYWPLTNPENRVGPIH